MPRDGVDTARGRRALATGDMRGIGLMMLASICFAVMNVFAKFASSRGIPFFEVAFFRAFVGGVLVAIYARARGIPLAIENRRWMAVRTGVGAVSMFATFFALAKMKLADATALFNTTPLWVALAGWLLLKETVSRRVMFALLVAPAGVVLILDPSGDSGWVGLVALAAACAAAIVMVSLRRLGATEAPEAVVAQFQLWASLLFLVVGGAHFIAPSPVEFGALLATGALGTIGQLMMTRAYALDLAARVGGGGYVTIVASALLGGLVLGESISARSAMGIAIILTCGLALVLDARSAAQRSESKAPVP